MENEKVISKIKKILELSRNNPSEAEAKDAALKAQRLMAEYHISMQDIEDVSEVEEIFEAELYVGNGNKWKYPLASVIAKNFMCKYFICGSEYIVFYGYKTDAEIARETFRFLFDFGNRMATNFYQRKRNQATRNRTYFDGRGIKNAYLIGYIEGIEEVLEKQCTALMLVTPPEVEDKFAEKFSGHKGVSKTIKSSVDSVGCEAREKGRLDGRSAVEQRSIACA